MSEILNLNNNELVLTKRYAFTVMSSLSEFTNRYIWPREQIINKEAQFYLDAYLNDVITPFRLSGEDGLYITAMVTPDSLRTVTDQPFISGVLTTRDNGFSQVGGYWEATARLPSAKGSWPAFWLLPTFENWPEGVAVLPEIDILEAVEDVVINGAYHIAVHTNETGELVANSTLHYTHKDLTTEYHKYGVYLDSSKIQWYFDRQLIKVARTPKDLQNVPMHFLLNYAVGGWGGTANKEDYPDSFTIRDVSIYRAAKEPSQNTNCDALIEAVTNYFKR